MQTKLNSNISKIILAEPRGFCAGVNRAIEIVDLALKLYGSPLYVRHEIVHNHHVVNDFKNRGVIFVEELDEVPDNAMLIFSAHGTSPETIEAAKARGLKFLDAVCPLVTKVHNEIKKAINDSKKVIYIGHRGHQEVLGAMGYAPNNLDQGTKSSVNEALTPNQDIYLVETVDDVERIKPVLENHHLVVATQTTLSLDDTDAVINKLKTTFQNIDFPKSDDICYATQNRQDAVKELITVCDYILVIGSQNSSNTLRLLELAHKFNKPAMLVPDPDQFEMTDDLAGKVIGISSGASAPEFLVDTLISKLIGDDDYQYSRDDAAKYSDVIEVLKFKEEKIYFPLPASLQVS